MAYLRERFQQAALVMRDPQMVYYSKMTEIIDKISAKGALHRVHFMGNQDYFFEVSVRDKGAVGMGSSTVTMECQLWPETNTCVLLQQTEAAAYPLFTCVRCSWQGRNCRDLCVTIFSEGGSNGYLEWRTLWLEGTS